MALLPHSSARPTLAKLGMQWLVLIVIMLGAIVSSIGLTSSHGLAATEVTHKSVVLFSDMAHGHEHGDQGVESSVADEISSDGHPHHAMDHSHDTAHHLPQAWGAVLPQLPSWEVVVRPWIDMGQADRLDRPPMG